MGLWEVTEDVLNQAERSQNEESVPSYAHISHRALKDIPKEYTNPYNCKVRALAFNNNHKVSSLDFFFCLIGFILSGVELANCASSLSYNDQVLA